MPQTLSIKSKLTKLLSKAEKLKKKKDRYFSKKYYDFERSKDYLLFAHVISKLVQGLTRRKTIRTGYVGRAMFEFTECFRDFGFVAEDPHYAFFGNDPEDLLHPYNAITALEPEKFDVLFFGEKDPQRRKEILEELGDLGECLLVDVDQLASLFRYSLLSIHTRHFHTCLNLHKLSAVCLLVSLCRPDGNIVEAGTYHCGTTMLMAKMLEILGRDSKIYALDTFGGIPAASENDRKGSLFYDEGMFTDANLDDIRTRFKKEGVQDRIELVPGLIQETFPAVAEKDPNISFAFLDTDQYVGTKAGLDCMLPKLGEGGLILIDDTSLSGVDTAIKEGLKKVRNVRRINLFFNVDLLINKKTFPNFLGTSG